jgi:hypothetical protein
VTSIAVTQPLANALLVALQASWALVGDGEAPDGRTFDSLGRLLQPYAVLYRSGPGALDGPVGDPNADGQPLLTLTCVGGAPAEAEWLADRLRPVLLGPLTVAGLKVMEAPSLEVSRPGRRDDTTQPPLWFATDQVRYRTTPV